MIKDDGGPAFPMPSGPEPRVNVATHYNEGKSLRDDFAGSALQGLLASGEHNRKSVHSHFNKSYQEPGDVYRPMTESELADYAFALADAMLRARKS